MAIMSTGRMLSCMQLFHAGKAGSHATACTVNQKKVVMDTHPQLYCHVSQQVVRSCGVVFYT